jgi:RIO kinase 1
MLGGPTARRVLGEPAMRMPEGLASLVDEGIIEEVLRPLMSGKEAQIYLVVAGGKPCVAKIYKEAQNRTFKHRADYTEGRKVRNSRDQRAIDKRSKHGRGKDEAAWRSTEVDMIYRLQAAGVRVPAPYQFIDGVLIMELVTGANGEPAPRLGEVDFSPEQAAVVHERLLREVVRMLCAGVVHGDLSDFNVLMATDGPVIIDLPQAVDPSKNQNARKLLLRDVDNLQRFLRRFVPSAQRMPYAEEMWALYESNQLTPETVLRGQYRASQKKADTGALLELIGEVNEDERRRRAANEPQNTRRPRRVEINVDNGHLPRRPASNRKHPGAALRAPEAKSGAVPAPPRRHFPPAHLAAPARSPRPLPQSQPQGASKHVAAPAASRPGDHQQGPPRARRRRRRKAHQNGSAPKLATERTQASNPTRPDPNTNVHPERAVAMPNRRGGSARFERPAAAAPPKNSQRPGGSR